jgi:hypothetical protein
MRLPDEKQNRRVGYVSGYGILCVWSQKRICVGCPGSEIAVLLRGPNELRKMSTLVCRKSENELSGLDDCSIIS